ncbi:MAG: hypothetical protein ACSLFM_05235 [Tepidiformaceae bacterium]
MGTAVDPAIESIWRAADRFRELLAEHRAVLDSARLRFPTLTW